MKTNKRSKSMGLVAAAVLAAGFAGTGVASADVPANQMMKLPHHYVVFGDGVTQSNEPGQEEMMGKPYGYVERVYEASLYTGRTLLKNYGLDGLTSTGFKNYLTAIESGENTITDRIQPDLRDLRAAGFFADIPDTKAELREADLITINLGTHDYGENLPETLKNMTDEEVTKMHSQTLATFADNMRSSLTLLHELAPDAKIVVADTYASYPANADKRTYDRLMEINGDITETLDTIAASMKAPTFHIDVAHVAEQFVGHEQEYTHILESDNRPNQQGYEVIAEALSQAIWGGQYRHDMNEEPINLVVKGTDFIPQFKPELVDDRTYVGLRELATALGAEVGWDEDAQAAILSYKDNNIKFSIGSNMLEVNGELVQIDGTIHLLHGGSKTYVPLRAISEGLGLDVQYIPQSNTAYINE
ncbi:stalk domain-containing protein [Tumebacillus permanentifrigoris]|uniref:Lysophospholipase L1-like esterase n=1 Tax=Tumebacillus permanentifrigoris TaxID=378543 RepID=A0A316D522_9BACL|nr:stalk domain-containing protein [Tumebacillus permanentifrigoris]PWK08382.1 lysophospholipase L1-like esterase [Tumebacillus permanentifrigoris]